MKWKIFHKHTCIKSTTATEVNQTFLLDYNWDGRPPLKLQHKEIQFKKSQIIKQLSYDLQKEIQSFILFDNVYMGSSVLNNLA